MKTLCLDWGEILSLAHRVLKQCYTSHISTCHRHKSELPREAWGEQAVSFVFILLHDLFLPIESLISLLSAIQKLGHLPRTFLLQPEVVVACILCVHKSIKLYF